MRSKGNIKWAVEKKEQYPEATIYNSNDKEKILDFCYEDEIKIYDKNTGQWSNLKTEDFESEYILTFEGVSLLSKSFECANLVDSYRVIKVEDIKECIKKSFEEVEESLDVEQKLILHKILSKNTGFVL